MAYDGGNVSDLITQEAQDQGVDPGLALSIGRAESGLNANAPDSPKGARGPMQVMQSTAPGYDLSDPAANVRAGVRYLRTLSDKYHGDHALIAAAYNAGPGAVDKHGGVPPFPETQAYVSKVTGKPSASDVMADFEKTQGQAAPGSVTVSDVHRATPEELAQPSDSAPDDAAVMADFEKSQAATPPPADAERPATVGSVAAQTGQGALEGLAGGLNAAQNLTPTGMIMKGGQAALDLISPMFHQTNIKDLVTGNTGHNPNFGGALSDLLGPGPNAVQAPQFVGAPQNFPERAGRLVGEIAPAAAVGPEGDAGLLGQLAYRAKNVLYPAATGTAAGEGVKAMGGTPQEVTLAQAIGSIPGSIAAVPSALEGLGNIAGNVTKPFLANVSQGARETQAGQILANAAGSGFKPAVSALEGYTPHVEGSPSTIGDVTGNLGLIDLSRGVVSKNPALNAGLVEGQAQARQASLAKLNTNASPSEAADYIRSTVANLDARTQADVEAATAKARAAADAVGGNATADTNGAAIRDAVTASLKASDAREAGLWQAIDPDKSLTGNVSQTRLAARNIQSQMSQYDVPMNADEQRIFGQAAALPDVAKLSDIVALRKSINDAASTEFATNGATATYARLSALRGALSENMATTIGDAVVKGGSLPQVQAWENGRQPTSDVVAGSGGVDQQQASGGAEAVSSGGGTALPAGGQPGSAAGTQSLSGEISSDLKPVVMGGKVVAYTKPSGENISAAQARSYRPAEPLPPPNAPNLQPTIDEAAQGRMRAANAATAEQAQTFRQGPVAPTLKTSGYAGQFTMPDGRVPGQFFKSGPDGFASMQALGKASPEAMPAIQDYAGSTLLDMAKASGGVITPKVLQRWQARYGDSIRALPPEMQAKFADAATAGQTVADAVATRNAAMESAQSGAIGKVMGDQDPDAVVKTVAGILRGTNATADMRTLVNATKGNPQAAAGLKQAVIDHITTNFITNTEAGASGVNKISADKYQTFLKTAGPALREVLKPDEFNRLTAIARDIQQSQRTLQATKLAGQSNTAQDLYKGGLPGGGRGGRTVLDIIATALGGIAAHHAGAGAGIGGDIIAGSAGIASGYLTDLLQGLRTAGINKVQDLVNAAVFDAPKAAALMRRVNGPQNLDARSSVGRAILKAFAAPGIAASQTQPTAPSALEGIR